MAELKKCRRRNFLARSRRHTSKITVKSKTDSDITVNRCPLPQPLVHLLNDGAVPLIEYRNQFAC